MPPTEISTGATVPISVTLIDDDGPATGETLTYQVSRIVGGAVEILDRADMTFRAALSVATPTAALPEVDDETSPGLYSASLVTASITNPSATGIYIVTVFDGPFATDILDSWDLRLGPLDAAALEATLTSMKGASFNGTTDSMRATRVLVSALPTAATVATQVWATAHGTPSVNTFGWLAWRLAQWGTEIAQKRIVGQNLVLKSVDGLTTFATVPLADIGGDPISPAVGEPARFLPSA